MAERKQIDPRESPFRKGYQPTGDRVDLSKVKPPQQGTAAQKPKKISE